MVNDAPLPSSFDGDADFYNENRLEKFARRLREEPLVPLGVILTCWALFGATRAMRAGDHVRTNAMFRRRIYAQGFTILAMAAGSMYWHEDREKRKQYEKLQDEKQRAEKRAAWLRELEIRDEEDKAVQAKREMLEKRREQRKKDQEAQEAQEAKEAQKSQEETRSALEPTEERGVLAAVQDLVRRQR